MNKHISKSIIMSLVLLLTCSVSVFAQSEAQTNRRISLSNDTGTQDIKVEISEDNTLLLIKVSSAISAGELSIEIYEPGGEKIGNYSVGCQLQKDDQKKRKEHVRGSIQKHIENPLPGTYIVRFKSKATTGSVNIQVMQSSKN